MKVKKLMGEFKTFISRGNVIDMAVGVIIGSAFGKIVSSLVENIIMPIIGLIIGGHDFTNLSITIKDASITYGVFIQNVVDFLIIAFCIFMGIKVINKATHHKKKEEEKLPPPPKEEIILLQEIRDLLKEQTGKSKKAKN